MHRRHRRRDLPAALSIARQAQRDDLVGNHPYLSTSKVIPALVLTGELREALTAGARMWDAWQRAGSPAAGWISPAMSAVALAHGLLGDDAEFRLWRSRAVEVVGVEPAERYRQLTFTAFVDRESRSTPATGSTPHSLRPSASSRKAGSKPTPERPERSSPS